MSWNVHFILFTAAIAQTLAAKVMLDKKNRYSSSLHMIQSIIYLGPQHTTTQHYITLGSSSM